ncbi:MAG: site-specific DNA-methyltransferase, partial [Planctomycetes bacterium]|nr:site-specific DNA-methyltransferase [Planctomycetota bacterium]
MPEGKNIEIKAAKGRPMLTWVGKRPLRNVLAYPAQLVEAYSPTLPTQIISQPDLWSDWPESLPKGGLLFHGDNKDVLAYLLANGFRGKVKLVYIDPPFDSGADYIRKVTLRGVKGTAKLDGEGYDLGEQVQYTDIWTNDNYLQFMYERLILIKELLSEDGSIALHCDARKGSYLRILLDEVFGSENFRGEVIVRAGVKNVQSQFETMSSLTLGSNTIFLYSKGTNTK